MSSANNLTPSSALADLIRNADVFAFDVDSTVSKDEGIDVLAAHHGVYAAVSALTSSAMTGAQDFRSALQARLALIKPTRSSIEECLASDRCQPTAATLTKNVDKLFHVIRQLKQKPQIYLVSGGFKQMISPLARVLGVPDSNIISNVLLFSSDSSGGSDGGFIGFDEAAPTSRSGGKQLALNQIRHKITTERAEQNKREGDSDSSSNNNDNTIKIVMIGDGATDLETRSSGAADAFIGFGGVAVRNIVAQQADWFIHDWDALIQLLEAKTTSSST